MRVLQCNALFLTLCVASTTTTAQPDRTDTACDVVVDLLGAELSPPPMIERTEEELERLTAIRPCLKSYPWPDGVFFTETENEAAISPSDMVVLRFRIARLVQQYKIAPLPPTSTEDRTAFVFHYWSQDGGDHDLLERFGSFLVAFKFLEAGQPDIALLEAERAIKRWNLSGSRTGWDAADHATYFSDGTLANLLLLLRFTAKSQVAPESRQQAIQTATEYANLRQLLSEEIEFLGDPAQELLLYTGCGQ